MGIARLESLTDELFEQVVQHLNLDDIRNVRLVCRSTATKAVQGTYRSFFRETHVALTRESLQSFATATAGIGGLVEQLTLIGVVYNPTHLQSCIETGRPRRKMGRSRFTEPAYKPEELEIVKRDLAILKQRHKEDEAFREEGTDLVLLRKAFSNIALYKRSPLKRLSLRIRIHRGDTVKPRPASLWRSKRVFEAATHIYLLAMESLRSSQLKLAALEIFFDIPEQLESSLPCDTLASLDLDPRLGTCLSTLKRFEISITDPLVDETKYDTLDPDDDAAPRTEPRATPSRDLIASDKNYSALSEILQSCPRLDDLQIVGYRLDCSDPELLRLQNTTRNHHIHHLALASTTSVHQLRKLYLANLSMLETDLLTLLRSHISTLRELDLADIRIPAGSFPSVVSYITGKETAFVAIRLEYIREGKELIMFRCDWEREGVDWDDRDVVRRWGIERKGDLDYVGREIGLIGWPVVWEWTLEEKVQEEEREEED